MTEAAPADPAVVAVAAVGITWLAALARALVAVGLGDETPRRAGLLRAPHRLLDRTGSVLVPSFLALARIAPIAWPAPLPLDRERLSPPRQAVVALVPPAAAALASLVVTVSTAATGDAVGAAVVGGDRVGAAATVAAVAAVLAVVWLLPVPAWPGGTLVGLALRGERALSWQRLARRSATPWALVVALVLAVLPDPVEPLARWMTGIA